MKTRDELYSKEAAELLRIITTYKTLAHKQLLLMFPGRSKKIQTIITGLEHQGRLHYNKDSGIVYAPGTDNAMPDAGMIDAFWVLLDFIERAEYHTATEFPVKIALFADAEMYDILRINSGQEALITHALSSINDPPRRIIIVDSTAQIPSITIPNTAGYCTVTADGVVEYYERTGDGATDNCKAD